MLLRKALDFPCKVCSKVRAAASEWLAYPLSGWARVCAKSQGEDELRHRKIRVYSAMLSATMYVQCRTVYWRCPPCCPQVVPRCFGR